MQRSSERALEFDTIRLLLARCCSTPMGKALAEAVTPKDDLDHLRREQTRLSALRRARDGGCILSFDSCSAVEPSTLELKAEKPLLEGLQLYTIATALQEAGANQQVLLAEAEELPELREPAEDLEIESWIAEEILSAVDAEGEILDEASPTLQQLRKSLRANREAINKVLASFFDHETFPNYVQEDFVTIRSGRLVIPIKIEHRNRHRGIVHDRSRSGESLFFEPIEVVELNNSLAEIQGEIFLEEARILALLTTVLFDNWEDVCRILRSTAYLDLLNAKACLAELYRGVEPNLFEDGPLVIREARHPLLDERLKELREKADIGGLTAGDGQPVVPIAVSLGDKWRVLLITGPNAGGKTVALKTAGLLAMMVQSGMQAPAQEYAGPVFGTISAEIGDYQDIISHLSSFSSHLTYLKGLLESMRLPALVLLDEIASATDPGEGSALAMAVLEKLRDVGALVMATTHLEALKAFAHAQDGMENACVALDPQTKRPAYRLEYGFPGTSYALETAREIGLPAALIKRSREYLAGGEARVSEVITKLQEELFCLRKEREALQEERDALDSARRHYVQKLEEMQKREQVVLRKIETQWKEFRLQQERALSTALEEVKTSASVQAARERARRAAKERDQGFGALDLPRPRPPMPKDDGGALAEGEVVEVPGFGQNGRVLRDWSQGDGPNVSVEIGGKKLSLPREAVVRKAETADAKRGHAQTKVKLVAEERPLKTEINLIGKTVDEALSETDKFLHEAILHRLRWVRIIHGRGSGALRRAISEHLKNQPFVERWHPEEQAAGGDGVTVVEFSD
jgi:DNA mismatch repair protein MutS2